MCEYCTNEKPWRERTTICENDDLDLVVIDENDELWVEVSTYYEGTVVARGIKISYCPMCGRKLKED